MTTVGFFLHLLCAATAYKQFQDWIPNGRNVPHPCQPNHSWQGVGHRNKDGADQRNPFGKDFAKNKLMWTKQLCEADSDGDGRRNGEELGDPDCTWTKDHPPQRTLGLSHPGICDPFESPECADRNSWVSCDEHPLTCPSSYQSDIKSMDLRLDKTQVPASTTNLYCQMFDLPHDTDYHVMAVIPLVDNQHVTHHIDFFGCSDDDPVGLFKQYNKPGPCPAVCESFTMRWAVGMDPHCYEDLLGSFRFGRTSFKRALIQVHWDNPLHEASHMDGSGLRLFYTNKLKPFDMGRYMLMNTELTIPPGQMSFSQTGVCLPEKTWQHLNHTVYISTIDLHMHRLGREIYLQQFRDGIKIADLATDRNFVYDSPTHVKYSTVMPELSPGDELRLTCVYKSTTMRDTVTYGLSTQDEMCIAFIDFYPSDKPFLYCSARPENSTGELCAPPWSLNCHLKERCG